MSEGRVVLHLWLIPLSGKYFENLWEEENQRAYQG
jgi:hypothetical protein